MQAHRRQVLFVGALYCYSRVILGNNTLCNGIVRDVSFRRRNLFSVVGSIFQPAKDRVAIAFRCHGGKRVAGTVLRFIQAKFCPFQRGRSPVGKPRFGDFDFSQGFPVVKSKGFVLPGRDGNCFVIRIVGPAGDFLRIVRAGNLIYRIGARIQPHFHRPGKTVRIRFGIVGDFPICARHRRINAAFAVVEIQGRRLACFIRNLINHRTADRIVEIIGPDIGNLSVCIVIANQLFSQDQLRRAGHFPGLLVGGGLRRSFNAFPFQRIGDFGSVFYLQRRLVLIVILGDELRIGINHFHQVRGIIGRIPCHIRKAVAFAGIHGKRNDFPAFGYADRFLISKLGRNGDALCLNRLTFPVQYHRGFRQRKAACKGHPSGTAVRLRIGDDLPFIFQTCFQPEGNGHRFLIFIRLRLDRGLFHNPVVVRRGNQIIQLTFGFY